MIHAPASEAERLEWLQYLADRVGGEPRDIVGDMPFGIYGVIRWGRLAGVILYTNYRDASIEMAWAGEPGWLTRRVLRDMWAYPFCQLGVAVVTGMVKGRNRHSQDVAERMGCVKCGSIPRWYGDDDAVIYAVTADQCRWVDEEKSESAGPDGDGADADGHEPCELTRQHDRHFEHERSRPVRPDGVLDLHP